MYNCIASHLPLPLPNPAHVPSLQVLSCLPDSHPLHPSQIDGLFSSDYICYMYKHYINTISGVLLVWFGNTWFQGWRFVLNNQLGGLFMGTANSSSVSSHWSSVVIYLGLGPQEMSRFHVSLCTDNVNVRVLFSRHIVANSCLIG